MNKPLVSIVVPVYNVQEYIDDCVRSIIKQTYQNIEVILVDDGSTDNCPEKCDTWTKKDQRIKVFHKRNGGLMSAWVCGLQESKGEYVGFVDSDDWIDDNMIEILVQHAIQNQSDMTLCHYTREFENGKSELENVLIEPGVYDLKKIEQYIFPILICSGTIPERGLSPNRVTKLFKRELLMKNITYYDFEVTIGEDLLATFANIISSNRISIIADFYPYHYRINSQSMTSKYSQSKYDKIRQLHYNMVNIDDMVGNIFMDQIANDYIYLILQQIECEALFSGYDVKQIITDMRKEYLRSEFQHAISKCSYRKLSLKNKVYLFLLKYRMEIIIIFIRKIKSYENKFRYER